MSTLSTTNLKNPSSGSNNVVLGTGGDTTITNNLTVSGTGNNSIAGTFQFNSGYGSVATAYGCRAWVNFNGTGTVAIRASGNVSSITDNGTGNYTVNFTTAMVDANYCAVAGDGTGQTTAPGGVSMYFASYATGSVGWQIYLGVSPIDVAINNVAIFR
jgi:hypothetical protein